MDPYRDDLTYDAVIRKTGFLPTVYNGYHFGQNAHRFWAEIMLQCLNDHNRVSKHELCTN